MRVILGALLLYFFIDVFSSYNGIVNPRIPTDPLFWIGFGNNFGRWPRLISISLLFTAGVLVYYGMDSLSDFLDLWESI
ncbi:MAG: hypothetical protein U9N31_05425 [Candidatus Marinimicrobia bacterium]|nr:hypothetical protein [Candidatus Neomarinimicrobiota bacterium]